MANYLVGIVSLLILSFYDPSLVIYSFGFVNEIALAIIGLLMIVNSKRSLNLIFEPLRNARMVYCSFWFLWGLYFLMHAVLGLTSFGFASSRFVRMIFAALFFLNIRTPNQARSYLYLLVALGCFYSITSCAFHFMTMTYGPPAVKIVHIPVVDVDFADLGIFGYMWPTNFNFPMQIHGSTLYRISSYFNESAAFAFFLEPILFYVLYLRSRSSVKIGYSIVFIIISMGLLASTSAAGLVAVFVSFLLLRFAQAEGVLKKIAFSGLIFIIVYGFYQSGIGAIEDVLNSKQGTIGLESEGLERGMGLLHGAALIVGTGYDFAHDDFYVSSNALLSNLQRGGVIGLLLLLSSFLLILSKWWKIGIRKLLKEKQWAAFAMLPLFVHLCIKVTYEFTFIYLINYALVYWYLTNAQPAKAGRKRQTPAQPITPPLPADHAAAAPPAAG